MLNRQVNYLPDWTQPSARVSKEKMVAALETFPAPPTLYPQWVVVVNFQAEKPGGPRAPEGKARFLRVVKGLQRAERRVSGI